MDLHQIVGFLVSHKYPHMFLVRSLVQIVILQHAQAQLILIQGHKDVQVVWTHMIYLKVIALILMQKLHFHRDILIHLVTLLILNFLTYGVIFTNKKLMS